MEVKKWLYVKELAHQGFLGELCKRHPRMLRTTEASRSKKQCLDESLSQDSEGERELSVSLSEPNPQSSRILPIETIKEIQESLDPSELLKYQLL